MSYTKLFSSIVTSTIWTEDATTCKVWVTMLAIADKHGEVHASIPGLAQIAGLPVDLTEQAIEKFLSPDKYSRTPDDEGRRIEKIEGGWLLLNHAKYRAMASKDEEKAASAKRQAAFKERKRRNAWVTASNGQVTVGNDSVTANKDIAEAEAEAESEAEKEEDEEKSRHHHPKFQDVKTFAKAQPMGISDECIDGFFDEMEALEWTYKGQPCVSRTAWQARFRKWATNWANNANQPNRNGR